MSQHTLTQVHSRRDGNAPLSISSSSPQSTPQSSPPSEPNDPAVQPPINTSGVSARLTSSSAVACASQIRDGKRLLTDFISSFLSTLENPVEFLHFQSSFGIGPDLLTFRCPHSGTTLYLPVSIMLGTHEAALQAVAGKIKASRERFRI